MEHITLILIWVLTWIYSHPHKRVFWPKSGCDLSLLSARDASRSPGSSCLLAYSHVDKMIHGLVVLPQLPPAFPSFTKDRQVVTSSRSSLLRLVCVLSPFQCIGPSALSLTGYLNTIYFLPPLSNCQLIYETKLIICQMSFDSEEGMYKRCSRIRTGELQSSQCWRLLGWDWNASPGWQGGERIYHKLSRRRNQGLPGTSCSTSSYFNIYRMLLPLKCKTVLLSLYLQIFYKCRYTHFIWELFQSLPLFPS